MSPEKKSILNSIIATIGPSCNTPERLLKLKNAGVGIFRVNMSHSSLEDLKKFAQIGIDYGLQIGLDTEGAQIRTVLKGMDFFEIKKGDTFRIYDTYVSDDSSKIISLYPEGVQGQLDIGCLIRLDFNGASVVIENKTSSYLDCKCISAGKIGNNKGVDILNKKICLPDLTKKDLNSLELLEELGINDVFISFCKSRDAVLKIKEISNRIKVTSKIESKQSINNLHSICEVSDSILIDRGDLTREINIMDIPFAQRGIIKVANSYETPCYVATNVFESLISGNLPTRAELNDVVSTLEMGAAGIVLAAETAIGNKPLLSVEIVKELIHRFSLYNNDLLFADLERNEITDINMKLWLNRNNQIH